MITKQKLDTNPNNFKKWMSQIDAIYSGDNLVCPVCGEKTGYSTFHFFPDNIGFCTVSCSLCGSWMQLISRVIRNDKIKAKIVEVDNG